MKNQRVPPKGCELYSFSQPAYRDLITLALAEGYCCVPFRDALETAPKTMILRHDIDFSIAAALTMAECEADLGVRSTYFVMAANDYYNPFAKSNRKRLKQIVSFGHEVGLHWDSSIYPADQTKMVLQFRHEVDALSDVVETSIISASQHIPTDSPLFDVEGHITHEAYSKKWRARFSYVSDSSMSWRVKTPWDLIRKGVDIHFLSHPLWWFVEGECRNEKLRNAIISETNQSTAESERFIVYMNEILAKREQVDANFRAQTGWVST